MTEPKNSMMTEPKNSHRVVGAWLGGELAREDAAYLLAKAERNWLRAARQCRRFASKGRHITGRPRPGEVTGEVTLRERTRPPSPMFPEGREEWIVRVETIAPDGTRDSIRFPLAWMDAPPPVWHALLRQHHKAAAKRRKD